MRCCTLMKCNQAPTLAARSQLYIGRRRQKFRPHKDTFTWRRSNATSLVHPSQGYLYAISEHHGTQMRGQALLQQPPWVEGPERRGHEGNAADSGKGQTNKTMLVETSVV